MSEEIQVPTLPNVKIIRDGKQVDTSAIDDYDPFMTFLFTASMAANIAKLRRYQEDRISKGKTKNFPLSITPLPAQEVRCPYPAQSLYLINDGPGQIFVAINDLDGDPTPLLATEALRVEFETHELQRFYVWSAPGTVATARAVTAL
jgi:hypothetical protein